MMRIVGTRLSIFTQNIYLDSCRQSNLNEVDFFTSPCFYIFEKKTKRK